MDVVISSRARRDLDDIWMFVAESAGVSAADILMDEMFGATNRLRTMSGRGRVVAAREGGPVRSLAVRRSWVLLYEADYERVTILRVAGSRRNLEMLLAETD